MITNRFALALKVLGKPNKASKKTAFLTQHETLQILKYLELEARSIDVEAIPMQFVASYIHQLVVQLGNSPRMKSLLIMICGRLEIAAKESILERYHFDKIVAHTFEQATSRASEKDEVQQSAFFVVAVMLRMRRHLPKAIIRALVRCYGNPMVNPNVKALILSYLMEAVVMTSSWEQVPELGMTLVDAALDPTCQFQEDIVNVLCYGLEKRIPSIHNSFLVDRLLRPLVPLIAGEMDREEEDQETVCNALVSVLRTWVGVFAFGLRMNGFKNLLLSMRHKESQVINILRRLLVLDAPKRCVLESYTGFIFLILKQYGLLEQLYKVSESSIEAAKFLNSLIPFCSQYDHIDLPKYIPRERMENKNETVRELNFDLLLMKGPGNTTSITGYKLPLDEASWDWDVIYTFITVVLPSSSEEAQSAEAKEFYKRLFEFFCNKFLDRDTPGYLMTESLCSLFSFLLSASSGARVDWGAAVISSSIQELKRAFDRAICSLDENKPGAWAFFKCFAMLISTNNGLQIVAQHKMNELVEKIGSGCTNLNMIKNILECLVFSPQPFWAGRVYNKFLISPDLKMTKLVIEALSTKRKVEPKSEVHLFSFTVEAAKAMAAAKDYPKLHLILRVMVEFLRESPTCQELVFDRKLLPILSQHGHTVICQVLGCPKAPTFIDIAAEIEWWMTCGNMEYVDTWDTAVAASFNSSWATTRDSMPSIVMDGGVAMIPAHLFGELSRQHQGREQLTKQIPVLLEQLEKGNIKEQRAAAFALAHFASVPETEDVVCQYGVAEAIMSSLTSRNSYTLRGTLIACMSLFYMTRSLAKVLESRKWEQLDYGSHSCVVPSDPMSILPPPEEDTDIKLGPQVQIEGNLELADTVIELLNPYRYKAAKKVLKRAVKDKKAELADPAMALAAGQLLGELDFPEQRNEKRSFISDTFQATPFMKPSDEPVDRQSVAVVRAMICEVINKEPERGVVFSQLPLPKYELAQLPKRRRGVNEVPEVYITDEDLQKAVGKTRAEFYQLSSEERMALRSKLLSSA